MTDYTDKELFEREVEERKKLAGELHYVKLLVETMKTNSDTLISKMSSLLDGNGSTPGLAVQIDRLVNSQVSLNNRIDGLEKREREREEKKSNTVNQLIVRVVGGLITLFLTFMGGLWYAGIGKG